MRAGLGLTIFVVGCTSPAEHKLPSASITPHLDSQPTSVACGDDVALDGNTAPYVRYGYTYDASGRLAHAEGAFTAGGADDSIDYTWGSADNLTHLIETRAGSDSRVEITANYDAATNLLDYTWDVTATGYHDAWRYAFSNFAVAGQPAREVITELGQPDYGLSLVYDASGRINQAVPDTGLTTTWTYDDQARTIAIDTGNGAFHGVVAYDDQDRELSETWGGNDPQAIASDDVFAWAGDRLVTATYSSGSLDAPHQLATVEVDTIRYDCATARAGVGRTVNLVKPRARR